MQRFDPSKWLFFASCGALFFALSFGFGLYAGVTRGAVYQTLYGVWAQVGAVAEEAPTLLKLHPTHHVFPARGPGDGVTVNARPEADDLILLCAFMDDLPRLRLLERDGRVVADWPLRFSELLRDESPLAEVPDTDWNVFVHGVVLLPDGSVVFNFSYQGTVKLNAKGEVVWILPGKQHHSVERAEGGGFWVCGRRDVPAGAPSPCPPYQPPLSDDVVMRISEEGEVVDEFSIPKLLHDNELGALLSATGQVFNGAWDGELIHLNKVGELSSSLAADFPQFAAGDLVISLRDYNLVAVIDPTARKVKWWRVGPWLRQHDPEFAPGGKLVVFNNNLFMGDKDHMPTDLAALGPDQRSNILELDPADGSYRVICGEGPGQAFRSVQRGKVELTPDGGLLIADVEGGCAFEVDGEGNKVWEYVNRYDEDEVAWVSEARRYPRDYFEFPVEQWPGREEGDR